MLQSNHREQYVVARAHPKGPISQSCKHPSYHSGSHRNMYSLEAMLLLRSYRHRRPMKSVEYLQQLSKETFHQPVDSIYVGWSPSLLHIIEIMSQG
mmetsp:Transcript_17521/g.30803  ORF Transcript_17521/g.30803 Transcript_17521/m.30803 type:complete len:96 (+) Transcript_17521:841-1128(+)